MTIMEFDRIRPSGWRSSGGDDDVRVLVAKLHAAAERVRRRRMEDRYAKWTSAAIRPAVQLGGCAVLDERSSGSQ